MYNLNWHLKENNALSAISSKQFNNADQRRQQLIGSSSSVLFAKIGDALENQIGANDAFHVQFYLDASSFVKFNLTLGRNSRVGVYADKNSPPTFTKFKIFETFDGNSLLQTKSTSSVRSSFIMFFFL
jgi:hypothetical protein